MKNPKVLLRRYFTDYFRWLLVLFLMFGGALLIGLFSPQTNLEFIWVIPVGFCIVWLINLPPLVLLIKAMADWRSQRVVRQRIFIQTIRLDPQQNMKSRFGAILGTAKYQLIDESGGVYRLCAAAKRSLLLHSSPETAIEIDYLKQSRLAIGIRLIPESPNRLPRNPVALLEFTQFFADYIRR